MSSTRLAVTVGLAALHIVGCGLPRDGAAPEPIGSGGAATTTSSQGGIGNWGGGGNTGGVGATGGGPDLCQGPNECPGIDTTCLFRSCEAGECGFTRAAASEPCTEDGGEVCDGAGRCVRNDGTACTTGTQCLSGLCVDDVCCASACDSACESCALAGTEGACTPHPAATDPELECAGSCDGARSCADGEHAWSKRFGDGADQTAWAVAFDSQANLVMAGDFAGDIDFGAGPQVSAGSFDVFVAKFASNGALSWGKRFGGTGADRGWAVATGPNDEVVVAGWFEGSVSFGGNTLVSAGGVDIFLLTLDPAGNHVRSQRFGGSANDWAQGVAVAADGSVVVAGDFQSPSISFGGAPLTKAADATSDAYVVKLAATGAHLWSASYGEDGTDQVAYDVALDGAGNPTVSGYFRGAMTLGTVDVVSAGDYDGWALGLDASGAVAWQRRIGGAAGDAIHRVAITPAGDALLGGEFSGTVDFGEGAVTAAGDTDAFVVVADGQSGVTLEASSWGDGAYQGVWGVGADGRGNVVHAGELVGSINLGGGALTSAGARDIYVAKRAATGEHLWSYRFGDAAEQYVNDAAVTPEGHIAIVGHMLGTVDFGAGGLIGLGGRDAYVAVFTP